MTPHNRTGHDPCGRPCPHPSVAARTRRGWRTRAMLVALSLLPAALTAAFTTPTFPPTASARAASGNVAAFWGWGLDRDGQTGITQVDSVAAPQPAAAPHPFVQIVAGYHHTLGLTSDGTLYAWGTNYMGALGPGGTTLENSATPIAVRGIPDKVIAAAGGNNFSLALTLGGKVYSWGVSGYSELGRPAGPRQYSASPGLVQGLPARVAAVAAGDSFGLALADDGTVYGWGRNGLG